MHTTTTPIFFFFGYDSGLDLSTRKVEDSRREFVMSWGYFFIPIPGEKVNENKCYLFLLKNAKKTWII